MSERERDIKEREREMDGLLCRWRNYVDIIAKKWPRNELSRSPQQAPLENPNPTKKKIVFYFHFRCGERSPLLLFNEFHIYLFFGDFLFLFFGQDIKTSESIFGCLGLCHSNGLIALLLSGFRLASGWINFQIDLQQIFCQPQNGIVH